METDAACGVMDRDRTRPAPPGKEAARGPLRRVKRQREARGERQGTCGRPMDPARRRMAHARRHVGDMEERRRSGCGGSALVW